MNRQIYFSASIRGGRDHVFFYRAMIEHINKTDVVLTEQVGDIFHSTQEQSHDKDRCIFESDLKLLKSCDLVIAEATTPSLGVGYELAMAEVFLKETHVFYQPKETKLSAMIKGNPFFILHPYETEEEALQLLDELLENN